ncbi:Nucleolar protein 58, partial [Ophiophagus hannah]
MIVTSERMKYPVCGDRVLCEFSPHAAPAFSLVLPCHLNPYITVALRGQNGRLGWQVQRQIRGCRNMQIVAKMFCFSSSTQLKPDLDWKGLAFEEEGGGRIRKERKIEKKGKGRGKGKMKEGREGKEGKWKRKRRRRKGNRKEERKEEREREGREIEKKGKGERKDKRKGREMGKKKGRREGKERGKKRKGKSKEKGKESASSARCGQDGTSQRKKVSISGERSRSKAPGQSVDGT